MQFYFFISFAYPLARCFWKFADNFELNLNKISNKKPYLITILGDSMLSHPTGINMIQQHMKALKSMLQRLNLAYNN